MWIVEFLRLKIKFGKRDFEKLNFKYWMNSGIFEIEN